jgi:hypothetical protein
VEGVLGGVVIREQLDHVDVGDGGGSRDTSCQRQSW